MKLATVALAALVVLASISCGSVTSPSNNKTDPFGGSLSPGGSFAFAFNSSNGGEFSMGIDSVTPANSASFLGLIFAQPASGSSCDSFVPVQSGLGSIGHTGLTGIIQKGPWCAIVYDPGGAIAQTITFQAHVSHP